jgi:hypothetical protein
MPKYNLDDPQDVARLMAEVNALDEAYEGAAKFDQPSAEEEEQEWWTEVELRAWKP